MNRSAVNLGLAVVAPLALALGLEAGCRVLGLGAERRVAAYIADWQRQWEDDFYLFQPDGRDVNRDGLRDREHAARGEPEVTRILFLGDSVTFGYGLPRALSYPSLLEEQLRDRGMRVEVFNVALPGWSPRQEATAYRRIARRYSPQHVVLALCLNDVAEMQNNLSRPSPLVAFLYRNSALVRAGLPFRRWEIERVEDLFERTGAPEVREAWRVTLAEIDDLAADVAADGALFTLAIFPFGFQVESGAPAPHPQRLLADFAGGRDMRFLDLLPALRPLGSAAFLDESHLSPIGAHATAAAMVASGLFTADAGRSAPKRRPPPAVPL